MLITRQFDAHQNYLKPQNLSKSAWQVEKLSRMITALLKLNMSEKYIWKPLVGAYISKVQTYLPSIFTESRKNPYAHADLTTKVGTFANRLTDEIENSLNALDILDDIKTIYSYFLKIQLAARIELTNVEEIDRQIAALVLAKEEVSDNLARVQALYYAYPQTHRFRKLAPQLSMSAFYRKQMNYNQKLFLKAATMAIVIYRQNNIFCYINHWQALLPLLTHFSFNMLTFINKRAATPVTAEYVFSKSLRLNSICIEKLSSLNKLPNPKKILALESKDSQDFRRSFKGLEKCVNIESLKISNGAWQVLSKPEKLKKLTLYTQAKPLSDDFLRRLFSIESLKCGHSYPPVVYDLSQIPCVENIKSLHITYCHYTKELLSKLTSLRKLHLRLDTMPINAKVLDWLNLLPNLKNLGITPCESSLSITLEGIQPCLWIETLERKCASALRIEEIKLIKEKFPNLKAMRTKTNPKIAKMAFDEYGITIRSN